MEERATELQSCGGRASLTATLSSSPSSVLSAIAFLDALASANAAATAYRALLTSRATPRQALAKEDHLHFHLW